MNNFLFVLISFKGSKNKGNINREEIGKIIGQANLNNYAESLIRLVEMEEKYS